MGGMDGIHFYVIQNAIGVSQEVDTTGKMIDPVLYVFCITQGFSIFVLPNFSHNLSIDKTPNCMGKEYKKRIIN